MNYDLMMEEQISMIKNNNRLLLHVCCAPCSSAVLERLGNLFRISILYYNPNITDYLEYNKRKNELKKFLNNFHTKYEIKIIEDNYEPEKFFEMSKGLEEEPERGARCYNCYLLRLEETARVAEENDFDFFTTTLTLSPYKNSNWINEIGQMLNEKYDVNYLYSDFKKKNGYKRSIELSREYNLYRQDFCGCVYSKK